MAFQVNVFTNDGLKTLSQISATNRLFIDRVFAIDDVINDNELVSESVAHFAAMKNSNVEAKIVSTGSDPETGMGRIVVSLRNTSSASIIMHTIVVTAHTEVGGVPTSEATFFGCVTNSDLSLPATISNPIKMNIAVAFNFSNDVEIVLSESNPDYLLSDEVSRFVTTHAASGASVGETQEIRGNKKFLDSPTVDIQNDNGLIFGYGNTPQAKITDTGNTGIRFTALGDFADGDQCFEFWGNDTKIMSMIQEPDDTVSVRVDADLWAKNVSTDEIRNYVADLILLGTSISPSTDDVALGHGNAPFANMYSRSLIACDMDQSNSPRVICDSSSIAFIRTTSGIDRRIEISTILENRGPVMQIVAEGRDVMTLQQDNVAVKCGLDVTGTLAANSDLDVAGDVTIDGGLKVNGAMTEGNYTGYLVKPVLNGNMQKGSIAMIALNKNSGNLVSGSAGTLITVNDNNEDIKYYKAFALGGTADNRGLGRGYYSALHAWDASGSTDYTPVMVICIGRR